MPEHIRALTAILILALPYFYVARKLSEQFIEFDEFRRRRNAWLFITLAAFLTADFWLYIILVSVWVFASHRKDPFPVSAYFGLLFVIPSGSMSISGLGFINQLFALSHQRFLSLVILLPVAILIWRSKNIVPIQKSNWPDRFFFGYLFIVLMQVLVRDGALTNIARMSLYLFLDLVLPYFVISRHFNNFSVYRSAFFAFILSAGVLALIAVFENLRHWYVYYSLINQMGLAHAGMGYLGRDGMLRAIGSVNNAIVLGYTLMIALGLMLSFQKLVQTRWLYYLAGFVLFAGMLAALSRGPWVGFVAMMVVFLATGPGVLKKMLIFCAAGGAAYLIVSVLPGGERFLNLLPFVGETGAGSVDYRERLLVQSIEVVKRNWLLGSNNYLLEPEMQSLYTGLGIIDITNTYLGIALERGLVALFFFCGFFFTVITAVYRRIQSNSSKISEDSLIGRSILATLIGILVTIGTVSSISIVGWLYWSLAAIGVAYARLPPDRLNIPRKIEARN
jgi:hypothetical protein